VRVIADLAPSQAAYVDERFRQLGAQKTDKGHAIATRVLTQPGSDEFVRTPAAPSAPGVVCALGTLGAYRWRSLANPPAIANVQLLNDITEVRHYTSAPTAESTRIAKFYDMTTGTMAAGFWNEQAAGLIRKNNLDERQTARVLATVNAAMMDALIACHDSKYAYWVPRPSQVESAIKPLIGRKVARVAVTRNEELLSRWSQTVLAQNTQP
jgi:hypothetical protein